jgi:hypothetical protein
MIAYYQPAEMERVIAILGPPDESYPAPREAACVEIPFYPERLERVKTVERISEDRYLVCDTSMIAASWFGLTLAGASQLLSTTEPDLAKDLLLSGAE